MLYIECNAGAAGDMIMGALYEVCGDKEKFLSTINSCGIDGVKVSAEKGESCGIVCTRMRVTVDGAEEICHNHAEQEHGHHVHEHHHGSGIEEICGLISGLKLSEEVKRDAVGIYRIIAEAEAKVHGTDMENIHFHEVGTLDAVADVVGCSLLMHMINPNKVVVSPINTGSGFVKCAHGILPVPAPATAEILTGIPSYARGADCELCTPTGAAVLKYFADSFGERPLMTIKRAGAGMGAKKLEFANCVRVFLSEEADGGGEVLVISANMDDMTGEQMGYARGVLEEAGALDVTVIPVYMKKNRPGILMQCIVRPEERDKFTRLIFENTSTRGMRYSLQERSRMDSRFYDVSTPYGDITVKESRIGGIVRIKPEYDSVKKAAQESGVSFGRVYDAAADRAKSR